MADFNQSQQAFFDEARRTSAAINRYVQDSAAKMADALASLNRALERLESRVAFGGGFILDLAIATYTISPGDLLAVQQGDAPAASPTPITVYVLPIDGARSVKVTITGLISLENNNDIGNVMSNWTCGMYKLSDAVAIDKFTTVKNFSGLRTSVGAAVPSGTNGYSWFNFYDEIPCENCKYLHLACMLMTGDGNNTVFDAISGAATNSAAAAQISLIR
jgi:hypothetical protein